MNFLKSKISFFLHPTIFFRLYLTCCFNSISHCQPLPLSLKYSLPLLSGNQTTSLGAPLPLLRAPLPTSHWRHFTQLCTGLPSLLYTLWIETWATSVLLIAISVLMALFFVGAEKWTGLDLYIQLPTKRFPLTLAPKALMHKAELSIFSAICFPRKGSSSGPHPHCLTGSLEITSDLCLHLHTHQALLPHPRPSPTLLAASLALLPLTRLPEAAGLMLISLRSSVARLCAPWTQVPYRFLCHLGLCLVLQP